MKPKSLRAQFTRSRPRSRKGVKRCPHRTAQRLGLRLPADAALRGDLTTYGRWWYSDPAKQETAMGRVQAEVSAYHYSDPGAFPAMLREAAYRHSDGDRRAAQWIIRETWRRVTEGHWSHERRVFGTAAGRLSLPVRMRRTQDVRKRVLALDAMGCTNRQIRDLLRVELDRPKLCLRTVQRRRNSDPSRAVGAGRLREVLDTIPPPLPPPEHVFRVGGDSYVEHNYRRNARGDDRKPESLFGAFQRLGIEPNARGEVPISPALQAAAMDATAQPGERLSGRALRGES